MSSLNIRTVFPNLLSEIFIRILLLLSVITVHQHFQRQPYSITPEELIGDYKKPRRDSIVPAWVMMSVILFVPLVILCLPLALARNSVESTHALLAWSLALLTNALLTESLKVVICRPRPDFFYRCFPNGIVTFELVCTGNIRDVIDGRKSFPSGHSSFSFCSLGFLSLWLYGRLGAQYNDIRFAILCAVPIVLATVIGFSRCCDNHHHWQDVVGGAMLGFVTSYICYKCYCAPILVRM
ncbi:unnamed protein product [Colias eurytheme]|nr:unnamed protein product [Colias eurytheme]